jgi:hypothetical protein
MFDFLKAKPGTDPSTEIDLRIMRLEADFEIAKARDAQAKKAADNTRANLASTAPAIIQAALIEENEARAGLVEAEEKLHTEKTALRALHDEVIRAQMERESEAKRQAFREAFAAYHAVCCDLVPKAIEVRRLAREAGEFLPVRDSNDLLFDEHCEPHVGGRYVPIWKQG